MESELMGEIGLRERIASGEMEEGLHKEERENDEGILSP